MIETDFQEALTTEWKSIHVPDVTHELHLWRQIIPWQAIIEQLSQFYSPDQGRIGNSLRIMVAMLLVQKLYRLSDREVVKRIQDSPYIQYFCNVPDRVKRTFISKSSPLTRFRHRLGVEGIAMIETALFERLKWAGLLNREHCLMDSTVQTSNIHHPNDVLLLFKALKKIKAMAQKNGTALWWPHDMAKQRWRAFGRDKKTPMLEYIQEFSGYFQIALYQFAQQPWPEVKLWLPLLRYCMSKPSRNWPGNTTLKIGLFPLMNPRRGPSKKVKNFPLVNLERLSK